MSVDSETVRYQLGREPRGAWRPVVRCRHGAPIVIVTPSALEDGEPFPTLYWLTCPTLCKHVSVLESEGATGVWTSRFADDPGLSERMCAADEAYRRLRQAESAGTDRCSMSGIAGQQDSLMTKCIHAHTAANLAGIDDPIGQAVLADLEWQCDDARCVKGGAV